MRLSRRSLYALRILPYLAKAYPDSSVSGRELSRKDAIPRKYLEQILTILCKKELLISERGRDGGYMLRLAPEDITLGDVIRAVEGSLDPVPCAGGTRPDNYPSCRYVVENCWVRRLMMGVRDDIHAILDQKSLADICIIKQRTPAP